MDTNYFQYLLDEVVRIGASDLHLSTNTSPIIRKQGQLESLHDEPALSREQLDTVLSMLLDELQKRHLEKEQSVDMGFTSDRGNRYRINIYYERGHAALAIRWLDDHIHSFDELNLPEQLIRLVNMKDGLVLMTGATGSGKTTTLASVIDQINAKRACHILTIEDPIEFIHINKKCVIHQREVGKDVPDFASAVRSALREDPDVVLIGEMRDLDTMRAALMLAETGHLVFSTLHTNDAVGVIDRMIGAFPGNEQAGIRQQLSMVLRAVITQLLLPTSDNTSRVPVNEMLWVNNAVSHLIREHKPEQIRSIMETGRSVGNQTLDSALAQRINESLIDIDQARRMAWHPEQLEELIKADKAIRNASGIRNGTGAQ